MVQVKYNYVFLGYSYFQALPVLSITMFKIEWSFIFLLFFFFSYFLFLC